MLNMVLKSGDMLQIGDNITIKLQSDSRAQIAIDAPREINIKRLGVKKADNGSKKATMSSDK